VSGLVVDTSAMVAILEREPEANWLSDQLADASDRIMAAATVVELSIVLESRAPSAAGIAQRALRDGRITITPVDEVLTQRAIDAWRRFGRGRHPASLNFGDCFTYALAEHSGYPILCVGDDFARTDLTIRRPPKD